MEKATSGYQQRHLPNVTIPSAIQNTPSTKAIIDKAQEANQLNQRWQCPKCKVINQAKYNVCELCKTPRPIINQDSPDASGRAVLQSQVSSQTPNEWKCPNCDILNPENFSVCRLCKSPRPSEKFNSSSNKSAENEKKQKSERLTNKSFYEILGIDINATQDQIKDRFRFLSQAFHPDKFATSTHKAQAEEDFKVINDAYQTLSDPQKREQYNKDVFGSVNPTTQSAESSYSNAADKSGGSSYKSQGISSDAMECFNQAWDLWDKAEENKRDDKLRNDVAALLMLAIHKAGAPFPRAHSFLAIFLEDLHRESEAAQHANLALQQNPNEFRAQLVKIDLSLKGVKVMKVGARDFVPELNSGAMGFAFDLVFKGLFMGGTLVHTQATQSSFKNEIIKLIQIYTNVSNDNTDVDEYLYMAEMMIIFGDIIKDIPMPGGKPNIFAEIVKAPVDKLYFAGKEQEVKFIRNKAEGRSMLFKP